MDRLDEDQISQILPHIGRRGGIARTKKLTPAQRKALAIKASKAAEKARSAGVIRQHHRAGPPYRRTLFSFCSTLITQLLTPHTCSEPEPARENLPGIACFWWKGGVQCVG